MSKFYCADDATANGSSKWYVSLETPLPLAQATGSPVPPPRQRHNPFNRSDNGSHQRSHSMKSVTGKLEESKHNDCPPKASITFWELHNSYGRPILADFNAWKHDQRKYQEKLEAATGNLINL